jgi:hypothetical protein
MPCKQYQLVVVLSWIAPTTLHQLVCDSIVYIHICVCIYISLYIHTYTKIFNLITYIQLITSMVLGIPHFKKLPLFSGDLALVFWNTPSFCMPRSLGPRGNPVGPSSPWRQGRKGTAWLVQTSDNISIHIYIYIHIIYILYYLYRCALYTYLGKLQYFTNLN